MRIFVHGLLGWGEADGLWSAAPYWGLASGDLMRYLRKQGVRCAAASVGPVSGAWDRACELYAQLTGSVTDYGARHAAQHGHARFGPAYAAPLAPDWSPEHPLDLIGHSFGGATIRLLTHLLAYGAPAEAAAGEDVSPLFTGGKADLVRSVTCIAAPHNGSTLSVAAPNATELLYRIVVTGAGLLGIDEGRLTMLPLSENDGAYRDLTVDGALALNRAIDTVPGVYYFSVPCRRTQAGLLTYAHKPELTMPPLLRPTAAAMGGWYDKTTPGGVTITKDWAANDGLVPTVSARAPVGAPQREARYDEQRYAKGVWHILPEQNDDHMEILGSFLPGNGGRVRRFYGQLMELLDQLI